MSAYHSTTPCGDWTNCTKCRLHSTRRTVITRRSGVIRNGVIEHLTLDPRYNPLPTDFRSIPHVLLIGEAPGQLEDMLGLAFWGPAGNILDKVLIECSRAHPGYKHIPSCFHKEHVATCSYCQLRKKYGPTNFYFTITNTVGCRPIHTPETTEVVKLHGRNRQPTDSEINLCKPHIKELFQVPITHVVCLGEIANKTYGSLGMPLPALHLFHPAFIVRLDYVLLPIIEEADKLRLWLIQKHQ